MLVPFDGSAEAERTLHAACVASRTEEAPLVVLCVVPIPAGHTADELPLNAAAEVLKALVRAQDICRAEGVVATFQQTYALNLAREIVRVADSMQASVIALPLDYQGAEGSTELMSSTVQNVLARAHCTVMIDPVDRLPRRPGRMERLGNGPK
jgi:nucleotide-binding universal stress UspA family protein